MKYEVILYNRDDDVWYPVCNPSDLQSGLRVLRRYKIARLVEYKKKGSIK